MQRCAGGKDITFAKITEHRLNDFHWNLPTLFRCMKLTLSKASFILAILGNVLMLSYAHPRVTVGIVASIYLCQ